MYKMVTEHFVSCVVSDQISNPSCSHPAPALRRQVFTRNLRFKPKIEYSGMIISYKEDRFEGNVPDSSERKIHVELPPQVCKKAHPEVLLMMTERDFNPAASLHKYGLLSSRIPVSNEL